MAIVYRKSDRIKVKIHDIEVSLAPMSYHDKAEISQLMRDGKIASAAVNAIKLCLKDTKGLRLADGSEYRLDFEDGKLTDETMDDLMNLEHSKELIIICLDLLANVPDEFIDGMTGKPLEGVKIIKESKSRKK